MPSFDTPSSALFFIRDYVEEGHLKPCVHLKAGVVDSGQLAAPGGYGPVCRRESFRIDRDDRSGATTFYGCPTDCSLFQEDPRKAPWRVVRPEPTPLRVHARPARRAWVAAAAMALVTLSGTALWWMADRTGSQVVASDQSWWAGSNKQNRPGQGSSDGQFGRDLFIQPGSVFAMIRPIAQVVIEAHFTTTPKVGAKVPPAEVMPLRSRDVHAALAGPPGQVRLDLGKLTRYRQQNDGSVVISNRFVLPQASALHQRPVEVLGDYRTLDVPLTAPEFEDGFSTVQRVDVLMTVNGQGVWHSLWLAPPEAPINWQRVQFPLDGLKARLAQGREE